MPNADKYPLLATVSSPEELKKLALAQLPQISDELRQYLIECVAKTGGHFGANLGSIELTVALHYSYHAPKDQIVWDVGHQTYGHKILTGRADKMHSIRQNNGLAGFPKRSESEYDAFGVGHSSTSISAALGMALANRINGDNSRTVAVIGDGAMTAGLAFEALNHGGDTAPDILVVLNDNDMSISPNVGALNKYLARLLTGSVMQNARTRTRNVLMNIPLLHRIASKLEDAIKGFMVPATLFEELGFKYYGPVDGHDVVALTQVLQNMREFKGPHFLHIITKKGHGYAPAKNDDLALHAVSPFDPKTGQPLKASSAALSYTQVFGQWLCDQAAVDERLAAITPAMREGSGMVEFEAQFPNRYFDVGIAEQHSVTLAAGMACRGLKPVVAIYSTFLQRAYDQLIHDVALQNLDVLFAVDRAGIVGADGPTHAGSFDYSFTRCLPNLIIMAAADEAECRAMLCTGYQYQGPALLRYPRGSGSGEIPSQDLTTIEIGKSQIRRRGEKVVIFAFGSMVSASEAAANALNATLINMRFVQPLDTTAILEAAAAHSMIVTIEENTIAGGAGSAITEVLHANNIHKNVLQLGLPNNVDEHGDAKLILQNLGLDPQGIEASIRRRLSETSN